MAELEESLRRAEEAVQAVQVQVFLCSAARAIGWGV